MLLTIPLNYFLSFTFVEGKWYCSANCQRNKTKVNNANPNEDYKLNYVKALVFSGILLIFIMTIHNIIQGNAKYLRLPPYNMYLKHTVHN